MVADCRACADGEPVAAEARRRRRAARMARSSAASTKRASRSRRSQIANNGDRPVEVGITVRGIPATPEPAGGNYYSLTREYYTLDGEPADLATVEQGARLVAVLNVDDDGEPGRAAHSRRSAPRRLRDRQPAHPRERRRRGARLAGPGLRCRARRIPRRPLRRGVGPLRRRRDGVPVRLHRPRRVARHFPPSGGADRGHVPARTPRPHRYRPRSRWSARCSRQALPRCGPTTFLMPRCPP